MKQGTKRVISAPPKMRLLPSAPEGLIFLSDKRRISPYLAALQSLIQKGGAIEVDSVKARASFTAQSRKHDIPILFAESGDKLYVKLAEAAGPVPVVLKALNGGPMTIAEIGKALAAAGMVDAVPADVMRTMSASNLAILRDVSGVKKWCAAATEPLTTVHTSDGNAVTIRSNKK